MTESDKAVANTSSSEGAHDDARSRLADLTARAAAKDAIKDYEAASELYSQAAEIQVELYGELSTANADLFFAYGRSLYNIAVSKSDVLGPKVAGEPQAQTSSARNLTSAGSTTADDNLVKNAVSSEVSKKGNEVGEKVQSDTAQNQPYFQFVGDENFDESGSEEEDGAEGAGEGGDEDEDDFANAFEVLDLARILYTKLLSAAEEDEGKGKGKSTDLPSDVRHIRERLADTHDLQAEISLEAERFTDAVSDLKTALDLKQSLFPIEDPSVAECHYKLSLALEFASANLQQDSGQDTSDENGGMKEEAISHMETSIESCKIRMNQEQKKLDTGEISDEDKVTAAKKRIANVKEIIGDMEQRVGLARSILSNKFLICKLANSYRSLLIFEVHHYQRRNRIRRMKMH